MSLRIQGRFVLFGLFAFVPLATPPEVAGQATIADPSGTVSITIGGRVNPRYEWTAPTEEEALSSFYLRRLRLDVRGHILTERLTFRVLPEMARTATLRDGYMNYAFTPGAQLRFGQFTVPFQWHRYVSGSRQHFAERGLPSETFGFPDGRDAGVMLHGRNRGRTVDYAVGFFDGAGRNVAFSNSAGNMASGRVTVAMLGVLPVEETDILRSPRPSLTVGAGLQGATASEVRPFDLDRALHGRGPRADWLSSTADVSLRWGGVSLAVDGYLRQVSPEDTWVSGYTGAGFMISAGVTPIRNRLDVVARYSELQLDTQDAGTRAEEWGVGMNLYHSGHRSMTRIQYLSERGPAGWTLNRDALIVEYSLLF